MKIFSIALVFRYIEVAIDLLNIIIYYASDTVFSEDNSSNNFGQFVLIAGLILGIVALVVSIVLEADKKYPLIGSPPVIRNFNKNGSRRQMQFIIYNGIAIVFFLAAGIIILSTWSGSVEILDKWKTWKNCGLTVGSLCIIQCFVLAAGAFFIFKEKGSITT